MVPWSWSVGNSDGQFCVYIRGCLGTGFFFLSKDSAKVGGLWR